MTCAPDRRGYVDQHTHTNKRPTARKILGVTCTQNTNTSAMRALLAENVPEPPGNVGAGPGTGWRSLRKICTARGCDQSEACQGVLREGGCTPAPGGCRRGSSRRTHTGGLEPPCRRSDRLKGTPDRGGRSQAGPGDRLGEQGGQPTEDRAADVVQHRRRRGGAAPGASTQGVSTKRTRIGEERAARAAARR